MADRKTQIAEQEAAAANQAARPAGVVEEGDWIPVFVCSLALPTVKCPLHVFEPR